jgi:hypothetical protein
VAGPGWPFPEVADRSVSRRQGSPRFIRKPGRRGSRPSDLHRAFAGVACRGGFRAVSSNPDSGGDPEIGTMIESFEKWLARAPFPAFRRSLPWRPPISATMLTLGISIAAGCKGKEGFDIPTAHYVSSTYGFSVAYPDTMDVREYVPERISIGFAAGDGFDARVEIAVESDSADSFESLLERKALDSCFADSPSISLSCTTIDHRGSVRAASREEGKVLYLTLLVTDSTGAAVDSMPRGPYIGFELPSAPARPTVLFVRAPMTRQLWETNVELVTNVARSLEI